MKDFLPDYTNIVNASLNREAKRIPLYEHIISDLIMEQVLGKKFAGLLEGNCGDKRNISGMSANFSG